MRTSRDPRLLVGTVLVLASASTLACSKSESSDVITVQSPVKIDQQALETKVDQAKAELAAQQQAFADQGRQKLEALDAQLEELKRRAQYRGEQAQRAADTAIAELNAQRAEARAALERAQGATRDQWQELKSGASDAMSRAEAAYNAALEKLKTD